MSGDAALAPWVVKLGGDVVRDADGLAGLCEDLADAHREGRFIVLIHGGGPQATELMRKLGLEPRFASGRRITDAPTLEAVRMAVGGTVSTQLAAALSAAGVDAIATTGVSATLVRGTKRPPRVIAGAGPEPIDFGLVGDVAAVRHDRLAALSEAGFLPVLGCLAFEPETGRILNVNADVVAADVARSLGAGALVSVSGVAGVLSDPEDKESRVPRLNRAQAMAAIEDGTVKGGMIAKLDEALRALSTGVPRVVITGPPRRNLLRDSLDGSGRAGTEIASD
jgi:acetylglutamate kinase